MKALAPLLLVLAGTPALPTVESIERAHCRWPATGVVEFELQMQFWHEQVAATRAAAAAGDEEAKKGLAILEGLSFRGRADLGTGVTSVEMRSAAEVTDPARANGLEKVRHGATQTVAGLMQVLEFHRTGVFPSGSAHITALDSGTARAVEKPGVELPRLIVDSAGGLSRSLTVEQGGVEVVADYLGWSRQGECSWLGAMKTIVAGKDLGAFEIAWAPVGDTWFPETVTLRLKGGEQILRFVGAELVATP